MSGFKARILTISTGAEAVAALKQTRVDPGGIALMSPKTLTRCIHLPMLACRQANVLKQEMLSVGGDAAVARGTVACSIDATDVILIGTERQLVQLCDKLKAQPFGLAALGPEIRQLLDTTTQPAGWLTARRTLSVKRPLIMGILNITPDSFSDGGSYTSIDQALKRAAEMVDQGADIIDIGGESTRPGAPTVSVDEELGRVIPVIEHIAGQLDVPLSIDTWKSRVAEAAVDAGAEIINDISGFAFDPAMAGIAARSKAGVVLMHTRGKPDEMQRNTAYADLPGEVIDELRSAMDRAVGAGVAMERVVLDPGIGFAKNAADNMELLRRLAEFHCLGRPILIGTSRKAFIGKVLGKESAQDRLHGTSATVAMAVMNGASILRVHDVAAMRDVALMTHAMMQQQPELETPKRNQP